MAKQAKPQPHQKLWLVRYGTMTQLVWAGTAEYAEAKVRTGCTETLVSAEALERTDFRGKKGDAPYLRGEMHVREATQAEVDEWHEAGGKAVEWWA